MPERFEDRDVKCPFYIATEPSKIICESYIKNATLQHSFKDDKERKKHLQCICNSLELHQTCRRYKMLSEFWEELGDE
jgi:hypothetical protein